MFAQIGDALPRFREYEMLFPGHERLRQTLCNAYLIILEFCTDTKSVFVDARKKPSMYSHQLLCYCGHCRYFSG